MMRGSQGKVTRYSADRVTPSDMTAGYMLLTAPATTLGSGSGRIVTGRGRIVATTLCSSSIFGVASCDPRCLLELAGSARASGRGASLRIGRIHWSLSRVGRILSESSLCSDAKSQTQDHWNQM